MGRLWGVTWGQSLRLLLHTTQGHRHVRNTLHMRFTVGDVFLFMHVCVCV